MYLQSTCQTTCIQIYKELSKLISKETSKLTSRLAKTWIDTSPKSLQMTRERYSTPLTDMGMKIYDVAP